MLYRPRRIVVAEAGHPVPDRSGQRAAARLCAMAAELGRRDLLIVLLSGGASSLLPAPVAGVTLADKQRTTEKLLRCGATIREINTVRKHLSRIKGGRLAELTEATIVTLILSDVLGDDLSAIASGPTVPDPTTYQDAVAILKRYRIWRAVPHSVRQHLDRGCQGFARETPKPGSFPVSSSPSSHRREQRNGCQGSYPRSQGGRSSNPRAYADLNRRGPRSGEAVWFHGEEYCARG